MARVPSHQLDRRSTTAGSLSEAHTALGNSTTGDATLGTGVLNGILSSKTFYLSTANGDRNLSDNTIGITAGSVRFDGIHNLTIGNVINSGGNRDLALRTASSRSRADYSFHQCDT